MFQFKWPSLTFSQKVFIIVSLGVIAFYSFLFQFNSEGIFFGNNHVWGDWPVHFTWASRFAFVGFPTQMHPLLYGSAAHYPWLSSFVSALLLRLSVPFLMSFLLPNIVISIGLFVALFQTYQRFLKSEKGAALGVFLLLTNGGIGAFYFLKSVLLDSSYLLRPPHTYSQLSHLHIEFINFVSGLLVPQRAFLLGALVGCCVLFIVYRVVFEQLTISYSSGFLLGSYLLLLPLAHTHAFMAVFGISFFWLVSSAFISKKMSKSSLFVLSTLVVSFVYFLLIYLNKDSSSYLSLMLGWYAQYHNENIFLFWFKNWTVMPFIAFGYIFFMNRSKKMIYAPFLFLFLVANIFVFQPYVFDNTKLFFFAAIGMTGIVTEWLLAVKARYHTSGTVVTVVGVVFISVTGVIEVYKMGADLHYPEIMYSYEEIQLAHWVRQHTDKSAVFVTDTRHTHFVPTLTGRQIVLGYTGWLDTYGFEYDKHQEDILTLLQNGDCKSVAKYSIDYLVLDSLQAKKYDSTMCTSFRLAVSTENYRVYANTFSN